MSAIKVLYVDDELFNLESFKASFRRQYDIVTAKSAAEAYQVLETTPVHVIVSDQRMPGITGVEFFKNIKEKYPDPVRILLTGYTDIQALADAVNHGDIYHYVTKPWNDLDMQQSINNAYDAYAAKVAIKEKVISLQKSNDELNRFVYSITHELRAPLASAIGIINLVKLEELFYSAGEYWEMMESCMTNLDYYINNIIDYYRNSRSEAQSEKIEYSSLISKLIALHKGADKEGNIIFNTTIEQPVDCYGDKFRIELVLGNLISNAIRYQKPVAPLRKVDIIIRATAGEVLITITDNGIGIKPENIDKIFTQFFRGQSDKGIGLGLFIVKEALTKLGGTVTVESTPHIGTSFFVAIPNHNH